MLKKLIVLFLMAGLILAIGCSKEDNVLNNEEQPPALPATQTMTVPPTAPPEVQAFAATTNFYWNFGQFFSAIKNITPVQENGKWVWVYKNTNIGFTVTVTAEEKSDGTVHWEVVVDGSYNGIVVNNYKAIVGDISADGKSGELSVYDTDGNLMGSVTWTQDENGNVTGSVVITDSSKRIDFVNNADGSGNIKVYENNLKVFEAQWQADGSGWWKAYDENGNVINEGSWGAGS